MGERITRLEIRAFRGVSDELIFDLTKGRSLLIFGDNATGKSSVADAIEWYFTGRIDYLSKENRRGGLRNTASRSDQETSVTVKTSGELGGRVSQTTNPRADVVAAANREHWLLRGRDLSSFIEKSKAEKLRALAKILGLEPAMALRADLYTARTNLRSAHEAASRELRERAGAIIALGIARADERSIVETAVALCERAATRPPNSLAQMIDEAWLLERASEAGATERHGSLRALHTDLKATEPVRDAGPLVRWNEFVASSDAADSSRIQMLENAREIVAAEQRDECPVCGQSVDLDALRHRIRVTLDGLSEASQRLDEARQGVEGIIDQVERVTGRIELLRARAIGFEVELNDLPSSPLTDFRRRVDAIDTVDPDVLENYARELSSWIDGAAQAVERAVPQLTGARDAAFSELTRLAVLARQWHEQRRCSTNAGRAKDVVERIYDAYAAELQRHVALVLDSISKRAADIYAALHPNEGLNAVSLDTLGEKAVEFTVDFHGKEHRPPQRVLSESHMNSLGLALFLAMHDTYNEQLGFLVLDDVVNSFDIEHRSAVANLLATEYDDRQIIVLTHDHQFYTRLARQAPSWRREEFIGWDYQHGPRTSSVGPEPLIDAARARLDNDDTIGAGQRARRALEEILLDACEQLQASLPFRRGARNERREANELLSGLRGALKKHAKNLKDEIEPLLRQLEADLQATFNVEAHAGDGRSSRQELNSAIEHIEALRSHWTCPDCHTPTWLVGVPGAGRCKCGSSHFPPPT